MSSSGAVRPPIAPVIGGGRRSTRSFTFWSATSRTDRSRAARGRTSTGAAADWIGSLGGERLEDRAELLAHHYLSALELARAAGLDSAAWKAQPG